MSPKSVVKSVNWHITNRCNYSCRFCFAQNLGKHEVSLEEGQKILKKLSNAGIEKINFAGGEPLLHPRLPDYCKTAKSLGMTVSVTTNGSRLDRKMIESLSGNVDWIALSVDSCLDTVEATMGRGRGEHVTNALNAAFLIHEADIRLKVNTVVTSLTWQENMRPLIRMMAPDRWKVMQMLVIEGENKTSSIGLGITNGQFREFKERHRSICLSPGVYPVFETADDMEGSYFMITPDGHVKSDVGKKITLYSLDDVLREGIDTLVDSDKYLDRGGLYNWKNLCEDNIKVVL
ncbi:radical SAM protein [Methanomicrobiaceae archaeon CYW5]|uniref:viperin family antiviral radical SAM protein n=1 Tax=Methanovulcanius yangii TaxID=1789227 RepID=UPI0029C9C769|nr:viperin family antiviral radical SAM protein [Methanovulcanius yangii]MBT8507036.1 radical SAM protein [Methanovulcanius yangii]